MEKGTLVTMLQKQNPVFAEAVSRMIDYIQDKWAAPYPSKEQTEDGAMNETNIEHRRIATQRITINAIRVLDSEQLDRLQDVLNRIAADREYYLPERGYGLGR